MDNEDRYEDSEQLPSQHILLKIAAAGLVIVAAVGAMWWLAETPRNDQNLTYSGARLTTNAEQPRAIAERLGDQPHPARVVGTAGRGIPGAPDSSASAGAAEPVVVQELEAITGAGDATSLVGRKVDLQVPVLEEGNPVTFWVGTPENRLLVVLTRDLRDGADRQASLPAAHGIVPVQRGQQASISGTIQELPRAEERYSWNLTREQSREVQSRGIYLRADSVRTDGHGE